MQAILSEALPLTATPRRGNTKMGNRIDINLCKSAQAKNRVIAYLIVFSEFRMTNASISSVALPLTAIPKLLKME